MPVAGGGFELTVMAEVAVNPPSAVLTVIVADPATTPVTSPLELTVATLVLLEVHVTLLFVAFDGATVAVNWTVPPTLMDALVGATLTPVTETVVVLTVIADVAVNPPSAVLTVMVADPATTPVTSPLELTVAMPVLLDVHVTLLFVAFDGETVAVNWTVPPTLTEALVGATLTPVTETVVVLTVIADVAVNPPSVVLTVMVADPATTPVTNPLELTVATLVLLEVHVTLLFVAFDGATVAVNWTVPPTFMDALVGATLTPVTGTVVPPPLVTTRSSKYAPPLVGSTILI
jgi:hypothetical protein